MNKKGFAHPAIILGVAVLGIVSALALVYKGTNFINRAKNPMQERTFPAETEMLVSKDDSTSEGEPVRVDDVSVTGIDSEIMPVDDPLVAFIQSVFEVPKNFLRQFFKFTD